MSRGIAIKILCWDIETSPIDAYVWGLWDQNIGLNQIKDVTSMLCFGAAWLDAKKVTVKSVHRDGREAMLESIWNHLDQADAVVSWNGKAFDTKHINREFITYGQKPPSPYKEIDLMLTAKSRFKFPSNKLDYVSGLLLGDHKTSHPGMPLWLDCMAGDDKAWRMMYRYQRQDVVLLQRLYPIFLPWITAHPNLALIDNLGFVCIACASENLQKRGYSVTGVSKFQRWQCQDCGKWMRGAVSIKQERKNFRPAT